MKKVLTVIGLILSFATAVYASNFCCAPNLTKEECCAEMGKMYCHELCLMQLK